MRKPPRIERKSLQIEKNVPIPARRGGLGRPRIYPFPDMRVGDSFAVPLAGRSRRKVQNNLAQLAWRYGSRRSPRPRYVTRILGNSVRCWRVE